MLWNEGNNFRVEISPQVTIVSMRWSRYRPNESHPFLLTAIYASPNFSKRKILWNYLKKFASSVDLPWILLGDFNDMLEENDKIGELPFNGNRIAAFRECVGWILNPWSVKCKHLWLTDPSFPSLVKKSWVFSAGAAWCIWRPKAKIDYLVLDAKLLLINMNYVRFFLFLEIL